MWKVLVSELGADIEAHCSRTARWGRLDALMSIVNELGMKPLSGYLMRRMIELLLRKRLGHPT